MLLPLLNFKWGVIEQFTHVPNQTDLLSWGRVNRYRGRCGDPQCRSSRPEVCPGIPGVSDMTDTRLVVEGHRSCGVPSSRNESESRDVRFRMNEGQVRGTLSGRLQPGYAAGNPGTSLEGCRYARI